MTHTDWLIAVLAVCFAGNILLGDYQAWRFDWQQSRINHTTWAIGYGLAVFQSFWMFHNLWFIGACLVMHLPVFNTALNYCRKPRRPLYYTHPADPQGSWLDKLWGKSYPIVFWLSIAGLIALIIKIFA